MKFEDQERILGRGAFKGFQNLVHETVLIPDGRIRPDLIIPLHLQRHDELRHITFLKFSNSGRCRFCIARTPYKAGDIGREFHKGGMHSLWPVVALKGCVNALVKWNWLL